MKSEKSKPASPTSENFVYIDCGRRRASSLISREFAACVARIGFGYGKIAFLCIGTDRATGDALGPLIGSLLRRSLKNKNAEVFGTIDEPVHAINLAEITGRIFAENERPLIVAIDASLGAAQRVEHVKLGMGGLLPGAALNKNLPSVGDIHISGIVNTSGNMDYITLQTTKLSVVMKMARAISRGLAKYCNSIWLRR